MNSPEMLHVTVLTKSTDSRFNVFHVLFILYDENNSKLYKLPI